jgi:hypothetical protein
MVRDLIFGGSPKILDFGAACPRMGLPSGKGRSEAWRDGIADDDQAIDVRRAVQIRQKKPHPIKKCPAGLLRPKAGDRAQQGFFGKRRVFSHKEIILFPCQKTSKGPWEAGEVTLLAGFANGRREG